MDSRQQQLAHSSFFIQRSETEQVFFIEFCLFHWDNSVVFKHFSEPRGLSRVDMILVLVFDHQKVIKLHKPPFVDTGFGVVDFIVEYRQKLVLARVILSVLRIPINVRKRKGELGYGAVQVHVKLV